MGKIADGKTALNTMLFVMTLSMAMASLMTHAYGMMDGISWQVFVGAGIYGAYTLGNPAPFDRLVSVSDIEGATCTFLVFTADLFGYVPTVVLMLWKTFSESGQVQSDEIVQQFVNALSIVVCMVVVCKNGQTACQACEPGFANDQEGSESVLLYVFVTFQPDLVIPFLVEPIGCWASTVARLQEARRHSQGPRRT